MFHYARGEAQQSLPVDVIDTDLRDTCDELVSHVFIALTWPPFQATHGLIYYTSSL